jgi:hypothetical protein
VGIGLLMGVRCWVLLHNEGVRVRTVLAWSDIVIAKWLGWSLRSLARDGPWSLLVGLGHGQPMALLLLM